MNVLAIYFIEMPEVLPKCPSAVQCSVKIDLIWHRLNHKKNSQRGRFYVKYDEFFLIFMKVVLTKNSSFIG